MRALLAGLLASMLLLAGCLGAAVEPESPQSTPALADPLAALEAGEPSANLALVGEWRNGGAAELAAWGGYLFVMRGGAVVILDVSDPANMTEVAEIKTRHRVLDVKVSHDGKYLFVGDDQYASGGPKGGVGPLTGGLYVYDVSDKAAPELLSYRPIGEKRGPHMVAYHRYPDGREAVFGANGDVSVHLFDRASGTLTEVARYAPDLVFGFNRDPEVVDVLYQGWAHDMFPMTEPDGKVYLYVANWDAGLRIVDVTDPARPKEVGAWNDFPDGHVGNLHTVSAAWMDGRRIVVGSVEVGFLVVGGYNYLKGEEPSVVYVWDATDPARVELLGVWENPMGEKAKRDYVEKEATSTHNLQLEEGRIYLAHYGLGLWVLDASTPENRTKPPVLAYYREEKMRTWDVVLHRGHVFTSGAEGVLALHYLPDRLGEGGLESRA